MDNEKVAKSLCDERYGNIKEALDEIKEAVNPHLPMLRQELSNHKQQHKRAWFKIYVAIVGTGVLAAIITSIITLVLQRIGGR